MSYKLAERDALEFCSDYKCDYKSGIRQWNKIDQ
jgi:hypothetical protein